MLLSLRLALAVAPVSDLRAKQCNRDQPDGGDHQAWDGSAIKPFVRSQPECLNRQGIIVEGSQDQRCSCDVAGQLMDVIAQEKGWS